MFLVESLSYILAYMLPKNDSPQKESHPIEEVSPIVKFCELDVGDFFILAGGYEVMYKLEINAYTTVSSSGAVRNLCNLDMPVERHAIVASQYAHFVESYTKGIIVTP